MENKAGVDQSISDAELITLLREVQEEMEVRGELNQLNLLLRDFAREQLRQHLLRRLRGQVRLVTSPQRCPKPPQANLEAPKTNHGTPTGRGITNHAARRT